VAKKGKESTAAQDNGHQDRVRPPGRWVSAWAVIFGQKTTPLQIEAEWVEYKAIFHDLLARHGSMLARHAKAEKERLDRTFDQLNPDKREVFPGGRSHKDELRARVASAMGLDRHRRSPHVDADASE